MSEWVILAGGLGSRSAEPTIPKILQKVGSKTVLDYLIVTLEKANADVVHFVLRHEAEAIIGALAARAANLRFKWDYVIDEGKGPVIALKCALALIESKEFGLILGDTLISAPLGTFFLNHLSSGAQAGVVVRQSNHAFDSDVFTVNEFDGTRNFFPKGTDPLLGQGLMWCATGILFLTRELVPYLSSTESDIVRALVSSIGVGEICLIKSSYYHRDTGTPERLDRCRRDVETQLTFRSVQQKDNRPGIFFDRDGTLLPDIPEGRRGFLPSELNLTLIELMRRMREQGVPLFLVTNQPQCAKGFIDISDVFSVHNSLQLQLTKQDAWFDDIRFCPHHPESGHLGEIENLKKICVCRKPLPGMVNDLGLLHNIDLARSIFVGDSIIDEDLSKNAGLEFIDIKTINQQSLDSVMALITKKLELQ
jgi:histidinol-phosphate phosphatase family protein